MGTRLLSLLLRPTPLGFGLAAALAFVVAETLVLYPLEQLAFETALVVVYLLGVVVVAIGWGFWLAAATSVASGLAFDYFHIPPVFALRPTQAGDWVAITIFLLVALVPSTLAGLARSRAAEANQRRRELERFFDLSSDLIGIGRLDGYFTRVNPAFERALGYSRQELVSQNFLDIVHPEDRNLAVEVLDELSRSEGPVHFENRCIRKDGSVVWLEWNSVVSDR